MPTRFLHRKRLSAASSNSTLSNRTIRRNPILEPSNSQSRNPILEPSNSQSRNNPVVSDAAQRGELPKLTDNGGDNNYADWASKSYHLLRSWGLLKYIEGDLSDPPEVPELIEPKIVNAIVDGVTRAVELPGNAAEREARIEEAQPWMAANHITLTKIVSAAPAIQMHLVEDEIFAKQAWENLSVTYKPQNSSRATTMRGNITSHRCTQGMDVAEWLTDMQRMYGELCRVDRRRLSGRDFALIILDNMPQTETWEPIVANLRDRVEENRNKSPAAILAVVATKIRDICWHRTRDNPQAGAQVFAIQAGTQKGSRNSVAAATAPSWLQAVAGPVGSCS
jgi:hypothetical protein